MVKALKCYLKDLINRNNLLRIYKNGLPLLKRINWLSSFLKIIKGLSQQTKLSHSYQQKKAKKMKNKLLYQKMMWELKDIIILCFNLNQKCLGSCKVGDWIQEIIQCLLLNKPYLDTKLNLRKSVMKLKKKNNNMTKKFSGLINFIKQRST